jgi:hypothetical protein
LRFPFAAFFFKAGFAALLALFFGDLRAGLAAAFFEDVDDRRVLPAKMVSQLSEYCFVAPTRTMLMASALCSDES